MMMDNLSAHKSERVRKPIEGVGRELVDLPSYSPDFDPIEGPSPRSRVSYVR
jgi:transposase